MTRYILLFCIIIIIINTFYFDSKFEQFSTKKYPGEIHLLISPYTSLAH
jgi:hypothetical protein